MSRGSFDCYINIRKSSNYKKLPDTENLGKLKNDLHSLLFVSLDDPTTKHITFTSFPGVSEREVLHTVQIWCVNMIRISQKETARIVEQGFIWKALYYSLLVNNNVPEIMFKDILEMSVKLNVNCSSNCDKFDSKKLSKVVFYSLLCVAVLYNIDYSIIETVSPVLQSYSKTSLALQLLKGSNLSTCPITVDFTVSLIRSMKMPTWTDYSILLLSLFMSGMGRNRSLLLNLQAKDLNSIGECVELFISHWIRLDSKTPLCNTCHCAFRAFLEQLPFCHAVLREVTQCTLFFNAIFGFYQLPSDSKRPRLENDTAAEVSLPTNCIVNVGGKVMEKSKSLLNCFLRSVQHIIQKLDNDTKLENVTSVLRNIVEICWNQCKTTFSSPAVFVDRKRKQGNNERSTDSESIPHFYLIILDLIQVLMGTLHSMNSEQKELCVAGVKCVLECAAKLCDYSVTNDCLVYKYICDMLLLVMEEPSFSNTFYQSQINILIHSVEISSLFLINNLPLFIRFINIHTPTKATDVHGSLSQLVNRMFTIYIDMRDINTLFSTILGDSTVPCLYELYTGPEVQLCLEQLATRILPLQLTSILQCLLGYARQAEVEAVVLTAVFFLRCLFHTMSITEANVVAIYHFISDLRQVVGTIILQTVILSDALFGSYMLLLVDCFAVERHIQLFTPIRYGEESNPVAQTDNLNVSLKDTYFGGSIPSLFTCMFGRTPALLSNERVDNSLIERKIYQRVAKNEDLMMNLFVERLVLLDRYFRARGEESIRNECSDICDDICSRLFNPSSSSCHQCLPSRYQMPLEHLALIISYVDSSNVPSIVSFLLTRCPCLSDDHITPCCRQRLLRSSFFYEIPAIRACCTGCNVLLQQMRNIASVAAPTEVHSLDYVHYIQLFNAFPNSYWTQSDRDAMAGLYPSNLN